MSKSERIPKPEIRTEAYLGLRSVVAFEFRISDFVGISSFGLRPFLSFWLIGFLSRSAGLARVSCRCPVLFGQIFVYHALNIGRVYRLDFWAGLIHFAPIAFAIIQD